MRLYNTPDGAPPEEQNAAAAGPQRESTERSAAQRAGNWWHYYKWYVIVGIILVGIAADLIVNALGLFETQPDLQIAYVGSTALPDDTVSALESAFADLAGDFNGDGKVVVEIHQYVSEEDADEAVYYETAAAVTLTADITDCESYLFLTDDAASLQAEYQIYAMADGSCPADADYSADGKVLVWSESPLLTSLELGSWEVTAAGIVSAAGDSQELLADLSIGRRCFYTEDTVDYAGDCAAVWEQIAEGTALEQ